MSAIFLTFVLALAIILGALWRRVLGGWTSTPRVVTVPIGLILFGSAAVYRYGNFAPWIYDLPMAVKAAIIVALVPLHFLPEVRFTNPWATAARYSAAMLILFLLTGFWPALAVGPICAAVYHIADAEQWPSLDGKFIDGWSSYGELTVGATAGAAFVGSVLL